MKKFCILISLFFLPFVEIVYSQTDSVFSYMPLAIGNQWQYRVHEVIPPNIDSTYYSSFTVEGDTIMPNGYHYKVISGSNFSKRYVNIDSTTACVYEYDFGSSRGIMTDSLRCSEGDWFGEEIYCELIDTATVLNYQTWIITTAKIMPDFSESHTLAMDIGMTYQYNFISGGPWGAEIYKTLVYANINGYEFGELVTYQNDITNELLNYKLYQNYPNPFNPETKILYSIPNDEFVTIKIFDVLGNEISTLVNEEQPAGTYQAKFNSRVLDNQKGTITSGVYFYQLKAGSYVETKKMILMK